MVRITYLEQVVKVYDFSLDTVGQLTADERLEIPVDDEIAKVLIPLPLGVGLGDACKVQ